MGNPKMPERFAVVGAGGHAKVVADALLGSGHEVLGFYDDNPVLLGTEPIPGMKVLGDTNDLLEGLAKGKGVAILAIGENHLRCRLSRRISVRYGIACAPSAVLGRGVRIGNGSMILPTATVNIDTIIGEHVILNTSCSVDHDCVIGDFVHIAPGAHLGGGVIVEEGTFLGLGSGVIPGIRIGRWAVIGAGAVVTKDLPDNCTAVGVPAKVIKIREEGWHPG
jgi:sugar O-acyltransferase (sialic acid O-acetyltransferase NeuD family)